MVTYDESTALLVVDVQNDFADPGGSLYVRGGEELIPRINDEVQRAVAAGALVVYTQDWHPESTPHFAKDGGVWPVHCVMDTWGAELHPQLVVAGERIRKGTNGEDGYSGFTMRDPVSGEQVPTPLDGMLREQGIRSVVVAGLATDYCVCSTVIDAQRLGYRGVVLTEASAAVDLQPGDGERRLQEAAAAGAELV
ncbi:MAG TPA: isochorismatase family protein [Candidatus Limnocylindria bacterium]|nr:isochorismatase family protein [Candidatus Limnocylindria bacterium]